VENVAASGEFWLVRPASEGTGVGVAVGVDRKGGWEIHPAKSTNPAIVTTHRRAWSLFDIGVHTVSTYIKKIPASDTVFIMGSEFLASHCLIYCLAGSLLLQAQATVASCL
jgi:hypothetical protein